MSEDDLEDVRAPKIGGALPHDEYIKVLYSIAKSLKRIADGLEREVITGIPIHPTSLAENGIPGLATREVEGE